MEAESSPSPTDLALGPFSALRSFDDADPGELAGEGWDSDADWGFRGPKRGRLSLRKRRVASIPSAFIPRSSDRLRSLAASHTVSRYAHRLKIPVPQQGELGVDSNGEGRDRVSSLSTRVKGTRKRLSSDWASSLPDHLPSRAPGLRQKTPRESASQEAIRGASGAIGLLRLPRRGNRTSVVRWLHTGK